MNSRLRSLNNSNFNRNQYNLKLKSKIEENNWSFNFNKRDCNTKANSKKKNNIFREKAIN